MPALPLRPRGDREKLAPYIADIGQAAREAGEDPYWVAALVLRESGAGWAPGYDPPGSPRGTGDAGHGHGLCQIDDRTWGPWLATHPWWEPLVSFRKACDILREYRGYLAGLYSMPAVHQQTFRRITYAAYNCGPHKAKSGFLKWGDPDHHTTGGNYSYWVLCRAIDLKASAPGLFEVESA